MAGNIIYFIRSTDVMGAEAGHGQDTVHCFKCNPVRQRAYTQPFQTLLLLQLG